MTRSPARLVIALSVAAALAVFILYTAIAGNATTQLTPSALAGQVGHVSLVGMVVGTPTGDPHSTAGLHFQVKDVTGPSATRVLVDYHGSVPDLFKTTAHIVVSGKLQNGVFVADPGSLVTKCPSKYAPAKSSNT